MTVLSFCAPKFKTSQEAAALIWKHFKLKLNLLNITDIFSVPQPTVHGSKEYYQVSLKTFHHDKAVQALIYHFH